jgi:hypothetical protein
MHHLRVLLALLVVCQSAGADHLDDSLEAWEWNIQMRLIQPYFPDYKLPRGAQSFHDPISLANFIRLQKLAMALDFLVPADLMSKGVISAIPSDRELHKIDRFRERVLRRLDPSILKWLLGYYVKHRPADSALGFALPHSDIIRQLTLLLKCPELLS